jgi:hypothetical protein
MNYLGPKLRNSIPLPLNKRELFLCCASDMENTYQTRSTAHQYVNSMIDPTLFILIVFSYESSVNYTCE